MNILCRVSFHKEEDWKMLLDDATHGSCGSDSIPHQCPSLGAACPLYHFTPERLLVDRISRRRRVRVRTRSIILLIGRLLCLAIKSHIFIGRNRRFNGRTGKASWYSTFGPLFFFCCSTTNRSCNLWPRFELRLKKLPNSAAPGPSSKIFEILPE